MKSKVDKLDGDKLVPAPIDLSKLSDVVKNNDVQKDVYNAKIKNIEGKIPDQRRIIRISQVSRDDQRLFQLPSTQNWN